MTPQDVKFLIYNDLAANNPCESGALRQTAARVWTAPGKVGY